MSSDAEALVRALAATPIRLTTLSRRAPEDALATRPSPGEWSATEIVNHLRANADIWGDTIRRMLDEDNPTIRYASPRGVLKKPEYSQCAFSHALRFFADGRKDLVAALKALPPAAWSRGAKFTGVSKRRSSETVFDYVQRMASHETEHIVQFEALFE